MGAPAADHLLHGESLDPPLRPESVAALQHRFGGALKLGGGREIQRDPTHVGLVADIGREDLERDRIANAGGERHELSKLMGDAGFHHGNAVSGQHLLGLGLGENRAPLAQRCRDDCAHRRRVGPQTGRHGHGGLDEHGLDLVVTNQLQKRIHRLLRRGVTAHCPAPGRLRRPHPFRPQPAREGRARRPLQQRGADARHIARRRQCRRRMNQQHRIGVRVLEHDAERAEVTLRPGISNDVDRVGVRPARRQQRIEFLQRFRGEWSQLAPALDQGVRCHHCRSTAVADDGETRANVCSGLRQHLCRFEQLPGGPHPQYPRAPQGGLVDRIGSGQRAAMRGSHPGSLAGAPGLHGDDGLVTRRRARRRHELARAADRLDVEQNRPRARILTQIVEQVSEIDIGGIAQGHAVRKPDARGLCPVEHGRRQGAGLGYEGDAARSRTEVGKARIKADARDEQPDAVRTENAQREAPCFLQHCRAERAPGCGGPLKTRAQDDRRACAA